MTKHDNIFAALAAAQAELKNPEKNKEGKVTGVSKTGQKYEYTFSYADIGDVLACVLPVLSKHGLALTQPTRIQDGSIVLVTRVHFGAEVIESEYPVCSLNGNHQAMGSAMTYARRYALTSLLGVSAVDDTDGEGAAPAGDGDRVKMTANQAKQELNWDAVQGRIDNAKDFATLDKAETWIEGRKGFWPDTYYWKAKERVTFNRIEMATQKMVEARDHDELSDVFEQCHAALDGKVAYDELAAIFRKQEVRFQ